ncbi:hypothetical protein KKG45_04440 [bacterium]|nr:hypothetical protein [bacterium]MBU1674212.1 hypothetical protein [bacterium]
MRLAEDVRPVLCVGLAAIDGIVVETGDSVRPEIVIRTAALRELYGGLLPSEIAPLQEARTLYKSVGIQPTRTRPSSEALLRRILKGGELYAINNAVDVCNLASLEFLLPIGLYDLSRIRGDVTFRLGRAGEEYPGIRKGPVHLTGRLGLFDDEGPFGSPTSDSLRTAVTGDTDSLLVAVMATSSYPRARMREHVARFVDLTTTHCGGRAPCTGLLHTSRDSRSSD